MLYFIDAGMFGEFWVCDYCYARYYQIREIISRDSEDKHPCRECGC